MEGGAVNWEATRNYSHLCETHAYSNGRFIAACLNSSQTFAKIQFIDASAVLMLGLLASSRGPSLHCVHF